MEYCPLSAAARLWTRLRGGPASGPEDDGRPLSARDTVAEAIRRFPETVPVFARHGLDTCCGGSHSIDVPESVKDSFAYFGGGARIATPVEIGRPGRIRIGNWTCLGRHGQIMMLTDFS